MRRRLAGHGARPLRPARPAGGAADRLRRLPRRLAGQQRAQGGPQLRAGGQGHADGARGAGRGAGPGDPVLGVQPLRRVRGDDPAVRPSRGADQRPGAGPPFGRAGGLRRQLHRGGAGLRTRRGFPSRRTPARGRRRAADPAARHRRHPAGRTPGQLPARRGGHRDPGAQPHVHRPVPARRPEFAAAGAVRLDGRDGAADRRADRAAAGEPAARPAHLLHAGQRPLPSPPAAAAGRLLRPAQSGRPGPAPPVQRLGRRDPGPRPGLRGRRRGGRRAVRGPAVDLRSAADADRHRDRAAQRGRAAGGGPAAGHRHPEAAGRLRPAHQHLLQRPPADRDDEGHRRRERLLPALVGTARHHAGRTAAAGCAERGAGRGGAHPGGAQQRDDPADRRAAGGRRPRLDRSAGGLPGPGDQLHRAGHPAQRRGRPGAGLRGGRQPAQGRRELPGGRRPRGGPAGVRRAPAGSTAT